MFCPQFPVCLMKQLFSHFSVEVWKEVQAGRTISLSEMKAPKADAQ